MAKKLLVVFALLVLVLASIPFVSSYYDLLPGELTAKQLYELSPRSLEFKKVISAQALTLYGCERQLDGTFACPRGER